MDRHLPFLLGEVGEATVAEDGTLVSLPTYSMSWMATAPFRGDDDMTCTTLAMVRMAASQHRSIATSQHMVPKAVDIQQVYCLNEKTRTRDHQLRGDYTVVISATYSK